MSVDTMAAHDEAIEEARAIVMRFLPLRTCGEADCKTCPVIRRRRRRVLAALTRKRDQPR